MPTQTLGVAKQMTQNVLRQISLILYRLKRQYGLKVAYYQYVSQTNDVETGEITREYNTVSIRRAPVLPDNLDRSFVYDLTFIAANNNFVGGAFFDRHIRTLIIDAKDLPKGMKPTKDDHIEFDEQRYEILKIVTLEKKKGYLFRLQGLDSAEAVGSGSL